MSSIRSSTAPIDVRQMDTVDYRVAWQLQRELADARAAGGTDTLLLLEHPSVYTAGRRTAAARAADRRHAGRRHRPRRQDHLARAGPAGRLSDHRAGRTARCGQLRSAHRGIADQGVHRRGSAGRPHRRPLRGVGAGRRRPAGAQGRRHRRAGVAGDDAARVRAQLRLRPGRVRDDRPVRHQRRRRDVDVRRTGPPGRRSRMSGRRSPTRSATPWTAGWRL